jgi:hypothetical protein
VFHFLCFKHQFPTDLNISYRPCRLFTDNIELLLQLSRHYRILFALKLRI